jgi:excisionase family DNA binding protein
MSSSREIIVESTELPRFFTVPEAAKVLGIGRSLAYELIRTDSWPTPVVRLGKLIKIPSGPLLDLLAGN